MKFASLCFLAGVSLSQPGVAAADPVSSFFDGNTLYRYCSSANGSNDKTDCLGYVSGVFDALASGANISGYAACVPDNLTRGHAADVVTSWLQKNPALREKAAASLVAAAAEGAFPCQ